MMDRTQRRRGGWSLIEVLVVIAIIALLLAILLTSLSKARERANAIVCSAQLKQLCLAENQYQFTNNEWIPGSPLTTGFYFAKNKDMNWGGRVPKGPTNVPRYNRLASMWDDYATTLRSIMYKPSSVVAPNGSTGGAGEVRARLIREAMEGIFHCPSNQETMPVWAAAATPAADFESEEWTTIPAVSYMTMWTLMRGGQDVIDHLSTYEGVDKTQVSAERREKPLTDPACPTDVGQYADWDIGVPRNYMPRLSRLGDPSLKVYLADGLRYYDETTGNLDYWPLFRGTKGLWMATPPSSAEHVDTIAEFVDTKVISREYNYAKSLSYRHGDKDRINAGFFDGHVESLLVSGHKVPNDQLPSTRFRGPATHPKYYYPSGSVVNNPSALHCNTIAPGTKLQ